MQGPSLCATLLWAAVATMAAIGVWAGEEKDGPTMRQISITLSVPTPAWRVGIEEIRKVRDELWALSSLAPLEGIFPQVLSKASDQVDVAAPDLPVRHFVTGKTWKWPNSEDVTFVTNRDALGREFLEGELLYRRPAASRPSGPADRKQP